MEFLTYLKTLVADLGLRPLYDALSFWVWGTQLHLWYAPYIVLLIIEFLIGRRVRASRQDIAFNFAFLTIWVTIFAIITPPLDNAVSWIASFLGGPYLDLTFGANQRVLSNVAALLLSLFIYDFFWYWLHRLQHAIPVLWVTHKLHHVDQNMGVTTTMKSHPVSTVCQAVMVALPMALLFKLEATTIFWIAYSSRLFQHFVHMNINCDFGWLNYLVASPNQHRVHHSTLPEHRDKNLASYFPIIDVIFGTYYPPGKIPPPTGIDTGEKYETLWRAFMQPFTDWWRMGKHRARAQHQ